MKTIEINTREDNLLLVDGVPYSLVNYVPNGNGHHNAMLHLSAPNVTQGEIQRKRRQLLERLKYPDVYARTESLEENIGLLDDWLDRNDPNAIEFDMLHDNDYGIYFSWLSAQEKRKAGEGKQIGEVGKA